MKRNILFIVFILCALAGLQAQGYKVGDSATDFKLKNVDNKYVSLSDFSNAKGFIIVFTCNHCPYAKAYEERLVALDKKYKTKGYPVIAINPNDPVAVPTDGFEEMQKRAQEAGFTFPYLLDEGQKIYPLYGATRTPHVYVLQKTAKGNIIKYIGAIDDNYEDSSAVKTHYVANVVEALLSGQKVPVDFTKAIGCSIKVK